MLLTLALIVLALVGAFVFLVFIRPIFKYAEIDKIPGPPKHPLFGTLHLTAPGKKNIDNHIKYSLEYGPISRMWIGPLFPIVVLYHPSAIADIMRLSQPKGDFYKFLHPWLGTGLLTSFGKEWKRKRRMITPAFHFSILKSYQAIFDHHLTRLCDKWDQHAEKQDDLAVCLDVTHCTLDVIGECAFANDINSLGKGRRVPYVDAIYGAAELIYGRTFNAAHQIDFIYWNFSESGRKMKEYMNTVHNFIDGVITKRRDELESILTERGLTIEEFLEEKDAKPSFIDILLNSTDSDGNPLGMQEIRDETNTFMFEGHDTTSQGLSWCIYLLATHPEWQDKVYEEVHSIMGDRKVPTMAMLNQFETLKACADEALRMYPPVPIISRKLEEDLDILGYNLPKGTQVMVHPLVIHRQPDIWPDPDTFNPARMLPENKKKQGPYDFIPFSAGPRNCIGQKFAMQEELSFLATVFNRYRVELAPGQGPVELFPALVTRPDGGYNVRVHRR